MAPLKPLIDTPKGVEVCRRTNPSGLDIFIVINHEKSEQAFPLPWMAMEHLSGRPVTTDLKLAPYGVAVLTKIG
jgi:beta-galactosidase GanA